jgi:uncharacterized protein YdaU (DUF1376 family)
MPNCYPLRSAHGFCSMKPPAFQFYADDFIGGTVNMTAHEVGCYIRLLCYQWSHGDILIDDSALRRVAGGTVSSTVKAKFPDGKSPRLEEERIKQEAFRAERSDSGRKGAAKRWSDSSANSSSNSSAMKEPMAKGMANDSSPSPSPSPSPKSTVVPPTPLDASSLIERLGTTIFKRDPGTWASELEQRSACDVMKRPNWEAETAEILAWSANVTMEDRRFQIPFSLARLLEEWSQTLDKARTYKPNANGKTYQRPNPRLEGVSRNPINDYAAGAKRKIERQDAERLARQMAEAANGTSPNAGGA